MPIVTMPDGTQVQMPDNPDPALLARLRAFQQSSAAKPVESPSFLEKALRTLGGVGENALHAASGAVAQPVAGIAGLGAMANNALGLSNADPSKVVADTQNALTYDPKSASGQAIQQSIGKVTAPVSNFIGQKLDQYGQTVSDATGSPLYGAIAKGGLGAFPMVLGTKLPAAGAAGIADAGQAAVAAAPRQAALQAAHDAGYSIPPAEMISAPVGKALTGVAGKDQINRGFSIANQNVTNKLAATDLGVPPDVPFGPSAVAKVKNNANAVYDAIKKSDQTQIPQKSANGVALVGPDGVPLTKPAGPVVTDAQYAADINKIGASRANIDFGTPVDKFVQSLKENLAGKSPTTL